MLAVPNDAVRNPREAAATAPMLGLDAGLGPRARSQTQMAALGGGAVAARQGGEPAGAPLTQAARGDVARSQQAGAPAGQGGTRTAAVRAAGGQGGFQLPDVTDKECAAVTAAMAKKPAEQAKLDALRQQMMSGAIDRDAMRAETQKIYAAIGVDPVSVPRRRAGGRAVPGRRRCRGSAAVRRGWSQACAAASQRRRR